MNGKELFRGLSYISRRYIDEAEFGVLSPQRSLPLPPGPDCAGLF